MTHVSIFIPSRLLRILVLCLLAVFALLVPLSTPQRAAPQNQQSPPREFVLAKSLPTITANETTFREAAEKYEYQRDLILQTIGSRRDVTGEYHRKSQFFINSDGKVLEKIIDFPISSLRNVAVTVDDLEDTQVSNLFGFESANESRYNFTYFGKERIDELDLYVIDVAPKGKPSGPKDRLYKGRIWVDDHDLAIVKARIKRVSGAQVQSFPTVEIYREKIEGHYWFPTYLTADEELKFQTGQAHLKMVVRFSEFSRKP